MITRIICRSSSLSSTARSEDTPAAWPTLLSLTADNCQHCHATHKHRIKPRKQSWLYPNQEQLQQKAAGITTTAADSKKAQTNWRTATEQLLLEAWATRKTRHSRIFSSCKSESWQLFSSSPLSQMSWDGRLKGHLHSTFSLRDSRWR